MPPDISVVIVSWNVCAYLCACLNSLAHAAAEPGAPTLEAIVVDSASIDDTVAVVRARHPWVRLLPQHENVGFARGNNIGMAQARGRHILLLNPDAEVRPGALGTLVAALDATPDVGIVGPHTRNPDGSTQPSRRRFPTLATAFLESTWLQPYAPRRVLDHYYAADIADDATADVDWVQGHALMLRRAVYDQLGGLDERYFMYAEELDYCRRAKRAGWRVLYAGSAHVLHHGGQSSAQTGAMTHIRFQSSKLRYTHTYHGTWAANTLRAYLLASYTAQLLIEALKGGLGHKPGLRRARVNAYRQVLRDGLPLPGPA